MTWRKLVLRYSNTLQVLFKKKGLVNKLKQNSLIRQEYKRNLFSYKTFIFFAIFILLTGLNFYYSYAIKADLINQLNNPAADLNIEALKNWLATYNGFEFFSSFYFMSDEFQVSTILIFAWIGIFLSSELARQRASGYGNLVVIRKGYPNYAKSLLIAQSLYLATLLGFVILIQLIAAFWMGGADTFCYETASHLCNLPECILIILVLYLTMVFFCIAVNTITASCIFAVHNVYFIQALPFLGFALIPSIVVSGLSNSFSFASYLQYSVVPTCYLSYAVRFVNVYDKGELLAFAAGIILFATTAFAMYRISTGQLRKDYL
jgi:hypothetical protein